MSESTGPAFNSAWAGITQTKLRGIAETIVRLALDADAALAEYPFLKGEGDDKTSREIWAAVVPSFVASVGIGKETGARLMEYLGSFGFATKALQGASMDAAKLAEGGGGHGSRGR